MQVPTGVWKAVTHLVALVASFLLVLIATSVLPFGLGSAVLVGMIVAVGLVAVGVLEGPAVRLATCARAPADGELQVLSTVPDLDQRRVLVCRSAATTAAPVVIMGRFTVVSSALVKALYGSWVSAREVTALVVHARAHHRVSAPRRGEVTIAVLETPARMVVRLLCGVGRAFAWMPLGSLAWRLRGVVGVVCLVPSLAEGHTWPGVLGAGMIALSYLVPAAGRAIAARATAAGDAEAVRAGLGGVLVEVLGCSGQRLSLGRRQRLQSPPRSGPSTVSRPAPEGSARHLHLVRS